VLDGVINQQGGVGGPMNPQANMVL
jgi:hypothetical protein